MTCNSWRSVCTEALQFSRRNCGLHGKRCIQIQVCGVRESTPASVVLPTSAALFRPSAAAAHRSDMKVATSPLPKNLTTNTFRARDSRRRTNVKQQRRQLRQTDNTNKTQTACTYTVRLLMEMLLIQKSRCSGWLTPSDEEPLRYLSPSSDRACRVSKPSSV